MPKSRGAEAQFDAEYFFGGSRGPRVQEKWGSGFNGNIDITNDINAATIVWSPCGASTTFRINSAVTALKERTAAGDEVQIAIDSVDATVKSGFRYYITTKKC